VALETKFVMCSNMIQYQNYCLNSLEFSCP
jgi:hypothetical protein